MDDKPFASFRFRKKRFEFWIFCLFALLPVALLVARVQLIADGRGLHMWGFDAVVYSLFILWCLRIRRQLRGRGLTLRLTERAFLMELVRPPGLFGQFSRAATDNASEGASEIVENIRKSDLVALAVDDYSQSGSLSRHDGRRIVFVSLWNKLQRKLFFLDEVDHVAGLQLSEFIDRVNAWVKL